MNPDTIKQGLKTVIKLGSREELPLLLKFLGLNGIGVEIGVERGVFSRVILTRSNLSKLYSIDSWSELPQDEYHDKANLSDALQQDNLTETKNLLAKFGDRSEIIKGLSKEVVSRFEDKSLDFIYIDANHRYESVKEDITLWLPKLKDSGVIAGHDYIPDGEYKDGLFGVKKAVDEIFEKVYTIPSLNGFNSWFIIK